MNAVSKTVQLDLFINKKKELEESIKNETEESLKKQVRMQFALLNQMLKRLDKQEALIESLIHCVLE